MFPMSIKDKWILLKIYYKLVFIWTCIMAVVKINKNRTPSFLYFIKRFELIQFEGTQIICIYLEHWIAFCKLSFLSSIARLCYLKSLFNVLTTRFYHEFFPSYYMIVAILVLILFYKNIRIKVEVCKCINSSIFSKMSTDMLLLNLRNQAIYIIWKRFYCYWLKCRVE